MLEYDAVYFNIYIAQSSISDAGEGVFAIEYLLFRKTVGYFTVSIVREDISIRTNVTNATRFGFLGLEVDFDISPCEARTTDFDESAYIVPDYFCVAAKMNDPRNSDCAGNMKMMVSTEESDNKFSLFSTIMYALSAENGTDAGE